MGGVYKPPGLGLVPLERRDGDWIYLRLSSVRAEPVEARWLGFASNKGAFDSDQVKRPRTFQPSLGGSAT